MYFAESTKNASGSFEHELCRPCPWNTPVGASAKVMALDRWALGDPGERLGIPQAVWQEMNINDGSIILFIMISS